MINTFRGDRMFVLERLAQPLIEPVTLAEAKRHIRQFAGVTTEDDDISTLIQVAREWVEDYTGRAMIDQGWRLTVQRGPLITGDIVGGFTRPGYFQGEFFWVNNGILLRRSPIIEITKFVTVDGQGAETDVDPATYQLREQDSKWPRIIPLSGAVWVANTFKIEYRAGFADQLGSPVTGPEVVPATLKHAIKLIIGTFDENRSSVVIGDSPKELPNGLSWLLASQKCELGMA